MSLLLYVATFIFAFKTQCKRLGNMAVRVSFYSLLVIHQVSKAGGLNGSTVTFAVGHSPSIHRFPTFSFDGSHVRHNFLQWGGTTFRPVFSWGSLRQYQISQIAYSALFSYQNTIAKLHIWVLMVSEPSIVSKHKIYGIHASHRLQFQELHYDDLNKCLMGCASSCMHD